MLLHMGNTLAGQVQKRRIHSWLEAWHLHCVQKQTQRQLLDRALARRSKIRLLQAFQAWSHHVSDFRYETGACAGFGKGMCCSDFSAFAVKTVNRVCT